MMRLLIRKQIYMGDGYMLDRKSNWINISLVMLTIGVWYSVFTNGFIVTLLWLNDKVWWIVIGAVIGISMNIKDRRI